MDPQPHSPLLGSRSALLQRPSKVPAKLGATIHSPTEQGKATSTLALCPHPWADPKSRSLLKFCLKVLLDSRIRGSTLHYTILCYTIFMIYTTGVLDSRVGCSTFGSSRGSGLIAAKTTPRQQKHGRQGQDHVQACSGWNRPYSSTVIPLDLNQKHYV